MNSLKLPAPWERRREFCVDGRAAMTLHPPDALRTKRLRRYSSKSSAYCRSRRSSPAA